MKPILLTLLGLLLCCRLEASHIASADIRYEYLGGPNNTYKLTLTLLKACEPGGVQLQPGESIVISSSCTTTDTVYATNVSTDTLGSYCAMPNSCSVPTALMPGFIRKVYTVNVDLPLACADYKFEWSNCCRNAGIVNLSNPSGLNTYVKATMNNLSSLNTNVWFPNPSPFMIATGTMNSIPMHMVDAENDSIVVTSIQPMTDASTNAAWQTGFTMSNPLGAGSTLTYDVVNQVIEVQTSQMGKFALAMRVDEYRAGTLVGSSMRDFTIVALNASAAQTVPMPASSSVMHYVTCPGQSHSISVTFNDATVTDSVFLNIATPTMTGWTFTSSSTSAPGTATATISWTTPGIMNPANLPQFYFTVQATDNSCPMTSFGQYAIVVQTAQCVADSVWPGDANGDYTVNVYDPLAIAVAHNYVGSMRAGATTLWQAEYASNWGMNFSNGVDMKHADCNGDAVVNNTDLAAVNANWGLVHLKGAPRAKTTGVPDLYFDLTGISFAPGATVSVPVKLGNAANPMNGLYGLATKIQVDGITLAAPPAITYPVSWLGTTGNTMSFTKSVSGNNADLFWAYSRINHQLVNGQGTIAMLTFTIPANATPGQVIDLTFSDTRMVDNNLTELTGYNEVNSTITISTTSVNNVPGLVDFAEVVPNPSGNTATLQLNMQVAESTSLSITDMTGRKVYSRNLDLDKGWNAIALPASELSSGIYMIRLGEQRGSQCVKWIKN